MSRRDVSSLKESALEDVNRALFLADRGHVAFGALREPLERLPHMLRYELTRREEPLTPFVKNATQTAREWLGQLDWPSAFPNHDERAVAEDLSWSLRALLARS
jgi:hypothetical protein